MAQVGDLPPSNFAPADPPAAELARSAPSPRAPPSGDESGHQELDHTSAVAEAVRTYQDRPPTKSPEPKPPEMYDASKMPKKEDKEREAKEAEKADREKLEKNRKQQERKEKKEKKEREKKEKKDKKDKERADKKGKTRDELPRDTSKSKRGIVGLIVGDKKTNRDRTVTTGTTTTTAPTPATPSVVPPITPVAPPSAAEQQTSSRRPRSARGHEHSTITRSPRVVSTVSTSPRHHQSSTKSPRDRERERDRDLTTSGRMRRAEEPHTRPDQGRSTSGKRHNLRPRSGLSDRDHEKHDSFLRLQKLLQSKGLGQYAFVFEERRIGYEQLLRMDVADLRELPLPPAARKRLHDEIQHLNGVPVVDASSPRHQPLLRRPTSDEAPQLRPKSTGLLERLDSLSMATAVQEHQGLARVENYREEVTKLEASVLQWKQKYQDAVEVNQKLDKFIKDHFAAYHAFLRAQEEEFSKAVSHANSAPSNALSLSSSAHTASSAANAISQPVVAPAPVLMAPSPPVAPVRPPGSPAVSPSNSRVVAPTQANAPAAAAASAGGAQPQAEPVLSPPLSPSMSRDSAAGTAQSQPLNAISSHERLASALIQFRINSTSTSNLLPSGEKVQRPRARCLYDYTADNQKELSFKAGDVLTILNQDQSGWWLAFLHGKSGFVPRNYLHVLPAQ